MNVQYYKEPYRLVNDGDVHELGQDFDEAIILLATSKLKFEQNQTEGKEFFSLYKDELKSVRKTNVDKIDWMPSLRSGGRGGGGQAVHPFLSTAQIGANYGLRGGHF